MLNNMQNLARVHATVKGSVQGIGYRWFVQKTAQRLGLAGWVRNLDDGDVELEAEGDKKLLDDFLGLLEQGHKWAQVSEVETQWLPNENNYFGFEIKL